MSVIRHPGRVIALHVRERVPGSRRSSPKATRMFAASPNLSWIPDQRAAKCNSRTLSGMTDDREARA